MLSKITTLIIAVLFSNLLAGQTCPVINENGSFEEMIYIPGGEASIGITTGQISNWYATHGTVDYVTPDWNWYDIEGINSVGGHMCYGNRETHDHSEGMFTSVSIHGDDDLLYTLSLDYGTVCESSQNGFLNIALNNNLEEGAHNWFQFPTAEVFPEVYQDIQVVDRMELLPSSNIEISGMSNFQVSFVPTGDYQQIWMFTEYEHIQEDFVNCGIVIDDVKLTATTSALTGITVAELIEENFQLSPEFSKDLDVVSYHWTVDDVAAGTEEELIYNFTDGIYTICLDIIDSRGACGSTCYELDLTSTIAEETNSVSCTYSSCLDSNGLPNLVGFEFLNGNGTHVSIDENTEGFFFPYCDGTPSMCNGGESEVDLFIEDLNAYFYNHSIDALASAGDGANMFETACRSLAVTIVSSDIIPSAILIDDFSVAEVFITTAEFEFDPSACGSSLVGEDDELNTFANFDNIDELEQNNGLDFYYSKASRDQNFNPVVYNGQLKLDKKKKEEKEAEEVEVSKESLISDVSIYTVNGSKIASINDHVDGESINVNHLPAGVYVVNLINQEEQKAGFFYVSDQLN